MRTKQKQAAVVCAVAALALFMLAGKIAISNEEPRYRVEDGKVDDNIFRGYQAYTRACMACHGPDGVGSSFAPSLLRAAERRTFAEFARTVAEGQEIQPGQVMPSFSDDAFVMEHVSDIYTYLSARAAGDLGRGRPQRIEEDE
ncbi:MAG: c-type cytochrome [Ectothiorhodospiraceae bacterium]|nr:c-type cytochrome [Ectothiorhodospiraceae bacterium]MCH8504143.1 cytochrome c [Ectothiorhodospiraceae bacterium]